MKDADPSGASGYETITQKMLKNRHEILQL